jgi:rare lipoprotein A
VALSDRVRLAVKHLVLVVGFLPALLTVKANAEIGFASHYGHGDGFHGRRTASGERFNKMAMTAAHRTRRMGTHVAVTNLANGRSVVVRISDRGPARRTGKIIDLSYGASRAIGMGATARVSVQSVRSEQMVTRNGYGNVRACDAPVLAEGITRLSLTDRCPM